MRVVVYEDSVYRRAGTAIHGEYAFTAFLAGLSSQMPVRILGRLAPGPGPARYELPPEVDFSPLPYYESLSHPLTVIPTLTGAMRRFWRALDDAEVVWLFGPYLQAQIFVILALLRRRRVVLGVRQDFPRYVRLRRPARRWMHIVADGLEAAWRRLARRLPTVVVGPDLARQYQHSLDLLTISVSLITERDVAAGAARLPSSYAEELTVLSVGRLDEEKNPLLLADILARLRQGDDRWHLVVCGEGSLRAALAARLDALGVAGAADLRGHLGLHEGLLELYRSAHALVHVSWTEGFPQVLMEAFASGTPTVATAVGGVAEGVGDAAMLVAPGDAGAAADALRVLVSDPGLRNRLVQAGFGIARAHTMDHEIIRVADFLRG